MNDNVFSMVQGGKDAEKSLPQNDYAIYTKSGDEFFATGFLIFTTQHVAVMKDTPDGAIPVLVLPLDNLDVAELIEDDGGSEV